MEKKKLELSISGASKKTINSIEQAKSHSKNAVVIEKNPQDLSKPNFSRGSQTAENKSQIPSYRKNQVLKAPHQLHLILKEETSRTKSYKEIER